MGTLGAAVDGHGGTGVVGIVVVQSGDAGNGVSLHIHSPVHHLAVVAGQLVGGQRHGVFTLNHVVQGHASHLGASLIVGEDEVCLAGIGVGVEGKGVAVAIALGTVQAVGIDALDKRGVHCEFLLHNAQGRPCGCGALVIAGGHRVDADVLAGYHEVAAPVKRHLRDPVAVGAGIGDEGCAVGRQ